jgi:hypothetical protein
VRFADIHVSHLSSKAQVFLDICLHRDWCCLYGDRDDDAVRHGKPSTSGQNRRTALSRRMLLVLELFQKRFPLIAVLVPAPNGPDPL